MDELLHHCLREIAFDGDLGCNVSRLQDFIVDFYNHNASHTQALDDAFFGFVWSLVADHPTVLVGLKDPKIKSEVWIAPQNSDKRKAKAHGGDQSAEPSATLQPIPQPKTTPLETLQTIHGDKLRIALEPSAIVAAITGSHIRSPKITNLVYTVLQFIARGRDAGVGVVEIGKLSGYDPKTCFYLVKILTELDIVTKLRRGGVGTHVCIHNHFFKRNPSWKAIRDEEMHAETTGSISNNLKADPSHDENDDERPNLLKFTPIDARHLSSLPLISARVIRLLKASRNNIHASNNMLITLGFSNPTKTDRRFFQSRIREMIQQGILQKVIVPSNRKNSNTSVKCFRLVKHESSKVDDGTVPLPDTDGDVDTGAQGENDNTNAPNGLLMNVTIHKQIIDLIEDSGTTGMTLNELSASLCHFDKRTIELLLERAEKSESGVPSHLNDLCITSIKETSGREHRNRYFTIANLKQLVEAEKLDEYSANYNDADVEDSRGFFPFQDELFYESESEMNHFADTFKMNSNGRPLKTKRRPPKNPILPNGQVKRGRPRKHPAITADTHNGEGASTSMGRKRKRNTSVSADRSPAPSAPSEHSKETPRPSENTASISVTVRRSKRQRRGADQTPEDATIPHVSSKPRAKATFSASMETCLQGQPEAPDSSTVSSSRGREPEVVMGVGALGDDNAPLEPALEGPEHDQSLPADEPLIEASVNDLQNSIPDDSASRLPPSEDDARDKILDSRTEIASVFNGASSIVTATVQDPSQNAPERQLNTPRQSEGSLPVSSKANNITSPRGPRTAASAGASRVNVSHLRRENELFRLVQDFGGILHMHTKDLYEAHLNLLEELTRAGEPTSSPAGSKIDKRTVISTYNSLETKGRVKQLKTTITTSTGLKRPTCIIHLPEVEQSKINAFLADLAQSSHISASNSSNFVKIDTRVEYGADAASTSRGILPLQLLQMEEPDANETEHSSKDEARANQLFSYEDATVREVLLTERTTVAQVYGFIVGKALRCRQLHLATIDALKSSLQSDFIISKDKRIVDLAFFFQDFTVETYCSLVALLTYSEELTAIIQTEEGRKTLVHDLPPRLQTLLQVGRSRPRSRFLELLEVLRSLGLATPLQLSSSETPLITCDHRDQRMSFDIAPQDAWTANTPTIPPTYWQINEETSIYYLGVSEDRPPFWKNAKVATHADCVAYWNDLCHACTDATMASEADNSPARHPICLGMSATRSLRRSASWRKEYYLTWHQEQYLKQFVDSATVSTPLQMVDDQERQQRLDKLSWVTSAPQDAIEQFFTESRGNLEKSIIRMKKKAKRTQKGVSETKRSLAKKAEEARSQREKEWASLISKLHPEPLPGPFQVRVDRVRTQFLQSGSVKDVSRWEREIEAALHEAELASSKGLKISHKHPVVPRPLPPPQVNGAASSSHVASVRQLIEIQGPPNEHPKPSVKRKRKKDNDRSDDKVKKPRRHRFQWSADFDDLARDAAAIIRARCRNLPRLDWAAFEQVFPSVPRNTVRQRLCHIKETPGNEAYLRRLEDTWYDMWLAHKGSPELPDANEQSPSDFDLVKHVEFLRKHIDKDALRVGIARTTETTRTVLPISVPHLSECFEIAQEERPYPDWDFMWNAVIEEGREKKLKRHYFSRFPENLPPSRLSDPEEITLVESILKMTMGTPPELYEPEQGSALFQGIKSETINIATKNLLSRGVLSKSQRDPQKQKPGRQLKISEVNQNAIGGTVTRDTFQDALSLLDEIDSSDHSWHDWPLTATDGDCATLIELVSENKVDLNIDTSLARAARPALDWNSKKTDDDQIETVISVRYRLETEMRDAPPEDIHMPDETLDMEDTIAMIPGHGININNTAACCRLATREGLVDCVACLNDAKVTTLTSLDPAMRHVADDVLEIVNRTGQVGVAKKDISTQVDAEISLIAMLVTQMTQAEIPLMHWTGYDALVLVSAHYANKWTAVISRDPRISIFPRRWLDIQGKRVAYFWQSALRAVMGMVIFRPGIPQTEIRWRLRNVYDRQEVIEVLHYLQTEGYLQLRVGYLPASGIYAPFDDDEETEVYWFTGEKHWYQV